MSVSMGQRGWPNFPYATATTTSVSSSPLPASSTAAGVGTGPSPDSNNGYSPSSSPRGDGPLSYNSMGPGLYQPPQQNDGIHPSSYISPQNNSLYYRDFKRTPGADRDKEFALPTFQSYSLSGGNNLSEAESLFCCSLDSPSVPMSFSMGTGLSTPNQYSLFDHISPSPISHLEEINSRQNENLLKESASQLHKLSHTITGNSIQDQMVPGSVDQMFFSGLPLLDNHRAEFLTQQQLQLQLHLQQQQQQQQHQQQQQQQHQHVQMQQQIQMHEILQQQQQQQQQPQTYASYGNSTYPGRNHAAFSHPHFQHSHPQQQSISPYGYYDYETLGYQQPYSGYPPNSFSYNVPEAIGNAVPFSTPAYNGSFSLSYQQQHQQQQHQHGNGREPSVSMVSSLPNPSANPVTKISPRESSLSLIDDPSGSLTNGRIGQMSGHPYHHHNNTNYFNGNNNNVALRASSVSTGTSLSTPSPPAAAATTISSSHLSSFNGGMKADSQLASSLPTILDVTSILSNNKSASTAQIGLHGTDLKASSTPASGASTPSQLLSPRFFHSDTTINASSSSSPRENDLSALATGGSSSSSSSSSCSGGSAQKKSDLSPNSKLKFKQFYRQFKSKEKEGFDAAKNFAESHLELLPEKIHWRLHLEIADLAKRENRVKEARSHYKKVNRLQPGAPQGWLEYAKMEEEAGNLENCKRILSKGLNRCNFNESLMVKCLKHHERMGQMDDARSLLSKLKDLEIERTWRTLMEGALLEARQGNDKIAREVFRHLIKNVPWYGPIYQEYCRFEEKCEQYQKAWEVVEIGLAANDRYGPLWFCCLRLNEKMEPNNLVRIQQTVGRAMQSISKELVWKLYFEAAQIAERANNLKAARDYYVLAVNNCPKNLLWKVWMGGARTELYFDNIEIARSLLKRSSTEVPAKMRAMVLLEHSRLEEYAGNLEAARGLLAKAKKDTKHEWKVFLESVLLEMRANQLTGAIEEAKNALEIHSGTGRLWAVMIQLQQIHGIDKQMEVFKEALQKVPKSGEVWCEGARIYLQQGRFSDARKFLNFAIQFTPQYGDSFIELLRLELLENGMGADTSKVEQLCVNADPNYGALWLHCKKHPLDSTRNVLRVAKLLLNPPPESLQVNNIYRNVADLSQEDRRKAIFL